MQAEPKKTHRDALDEIFVRTSDKASTQQPEARVPVRTTGGIFDPGEHLEHFCRCDQHLVPHEVFQVLANPRKELILQHWSSRWLEETRDYIRKMNEEFLAIEPRSAWAKTLEEVREFFGFNLSDSPLIFHRWLGRVLPAEVMVLGDLESRGLDDRRLHDWDKVAASLANVFRRQLEVLLEELAAEPADRRPLQSLATIDGEELGGSHPERRVMQSPVDIHPPKPASPPKVQRHKYRSRDLSDARVAFSRVLAKPGLETYGFDDAVRYIDENDLVAGRSLERECQDRKKRKVLQNVFYRARRERA